jgi:DNA-binding transcriptional MerR regulator
MQKHLPFTEKIPDKFYFKIGEVSKLLQIPPYVLRFWESEFSRIKPKRTSSGRRLYTRKDIELILEIKHLLYEKKYTIQGARQYLTRRGPGSKNATARFLDNLRSELKSIRDLLD